MNAFYARYVKRIIDIVGSLLLLLVLAPIFAFIALSVKMGDGGKVFYLQERIGRDFKPFWLIKFRTMVEGADEIGPFVTPEGDPRITRVGRYLRRYGLDGIPQLVNVLRGEMSLVGPTPEIRKFVKCYEKEYAEILKIRPGIADYATLKYREEAVLVSHLLEDKEEVYLREILPEKIKLYKEYIERMSFTFDMSVFFRKVWGNVVRMLKPVRVSKFLSFLLVDIGLLSASFYASILLRFGFSHFVKFLPLAFSMLPIVLLLKVASFYAFNLYNMALRYAGFLDLLNIFKANLLGDLLLLGAGFIFKPVEVTALIEKIIVIDFLVSVFLISAFRFSKRIYFETFWGSSRVKGKPALIVGAGNAGEMIVRDMSRTSNLEFYPVAFVDDDFGKVGSYIHNVRVAGRIEDIPYIVSRMRIEAAVIAIPSLEKSKLRRIYALLKNSGVSEIKVIPRLYGDEATLEVKALEDISIEDLIGREEVHLDVDAVRRFAEGKRVLITGAGGSIGSEIVHQVCSYHPAVVILFEVDETELYNLMLRLKYIFPNMEESIIPIVGDITDNGKVEKVFGEYLPDLVFHAAAYKHVPLMEYFPEEAVKTNVIGTYNVCKSSVETGVEKFILISTDKAVNPVSVMGATKRLAEYIAMALDDVSTTSFVAVRFGNVLGSRGSVLPIFLEQLKRGGPLTVTHPEVKRYFMTIPEAVALVLQASAMSIGGEVMVLDMKNPVKIVSLAEELIRLHGLEPYKDIDIVFTGLRPGEKMYEELLTAEEGTRKTGHGRIFKANISKIYTLDDVDKMVREFKDTVTKSSAEEIKRLLHKYVATYRYS